MIKKGFLFVSNSTKPTKIEEDSLEPIRPGSFSKASIWAANKRGWILNAGVNRSHPELIKSLDYDIHFYDQHCYRNIFAIKDNWTAYRNLCKYLKKNSYIEIIHCNTPIGGVVGRLAGRKFKKKVIYSAHGFHFFKGAPLFNRTILKWIEQWMAHYTDVLITINQEDFEAAQKLKLKKGGKVFKVSGVGIDLSLYNKTAEIDDKLLDLNLPKNAFVCIGIGDVIKRKNYRTAIEAIAMLKDENVHFLICGVGSEVEQLKYLANLRGVADKVHFLGFRNDVKQLLEVSDVFLFSSLQEGLPRSTMESMAAGLPCIVSDIRGNRDLIDNGKGGFLIPPKDPNGFANAIRHLVHNPILANQMGEYNKQKIKQFDIEFVKRQMLDIFNTIT